MKQSIILHNTKILCTIVPWIFKDNSSVSIDESQEPVVAYYTNNCIEDNETEYTAASIKTNLVYKQCC